MSISLKSLRQLTQSQVALIAVCVGYIIAPLGMASVNVAIPTIAIDLKADAIKVGWLPTVYILSTVAFMLPISKLADMYGRKKVYVYGLVLNALIAMLSGLTSSIDWLMFYRFMQGVAGAMIFGTGIAIVSSVVSAKKRGFALGVVASCVYIGLTIAPAFGGIITEELGWRWVFYCQVPLGFVLIVYIRLMLHGEWKREQPTRFDYKGSLLFMLFTASFVFGLSEPTTLLGLSALLVSVLSMAIFILHQSKSRKPLIRVQLFRESPIFSLSLSVSFFMYASNFATLFLFSLYLQFILGYSPADTGYILLVQALAMAVVAPFAGRLSDRLGPNIIAITGSIIVLFGFILLNQVALDTSAIFIISALLMIGLGFGLFSTPNNSAIMSSVDHNEIGVASASMNLARTLGNLLGMSLVNLMIHYFIGEVEISSLVQAELMQTVLTALKVSLVFVVSAVFFSIIRWRITPVG